jgi:hypothetical protein
VQTIQLPALQGTLSAQVPGIRLYIKSTAPIKIICKRLGAIFITCFAIYWQAVSSAGTDTLSLCGTLHPLCDLAVMALCFDRKVREQERAKNRKELSGNFGKPLSAFREVYCKLLLCGVSRSPQVALQIDRLLYEAFCGQRTRKARGNI